MAAGEASRFLFEELRLLAQEIAEFLDGADAGEFFFKLFPLLRIEPE
jgi:hypothetical protein